MRIIATLLLVICLVSSCAKLTKKIATTAIIHEWMNHSQEDEAEK